MLSPAAIVLAVILFLVVWAFCNLLQSKDSQIAALNTEIANMGFVELTNDESKPDYIPEPYDPSVLAEKGWDRNWGEAAVMSPYFEILQRTKKFTRGDQTEVNYYEYLLVCPTFLKRPIYFISTSAIILSY